MTLPIFYVNLDSRPDRRAHIETELARVGLSAERIAASTIDDVPAATLARISAPGYLWRVRPGDLACGLSHEKIWRMIVDRNLPAALILEDDAVLSDAVRPFLDPALIARLNARLIRLETRRRAVALGAVEAQVGDIAMRALGSTHVGTAGYIITAEAAAAALASPLLGRMAPDRFLFGHGGAFLWRTPILQADPGPIVQLDRVLLGDPDDRLAAARSSISANAARRTGANRISRKRRPLDVLRLELSLLGPRLATLLRHPAMLGRRRQIGFVDDP